MLETEYGDSLDGRIHITVPEIKGSHAMASEMESLLATLEGVAHVNANPLTGSVLVLFDAQVMSHYHVFAVINDLTCLHGWASVAPHRTTQPVRRKFKQHSVCTKSFREPTTTVGER
jgi:hypothetical protein